MDNKALYNISYGVFLLGSRDGEKINACITNTCMQVAANPTRLAITSINQNLTCEMIKKSGVFCLSILDSKTSFDFIKRFGYQSGRNADKFEGQEHLLDMNGCPYTTESTCSVISCRVVSSEDLGSHTLFIAEIDDASIVGKGEPLTYAYYQDRIKPKPQEKPKGKIIGWRCKICGYEHMESTLPDDFECPLCGHPAEDFEPIYES